MAYVYYYQHSATCIGAYCAICRENFFFLYVQNSSYIFDYTGWQFSLKMAQKCVKTCRGVLIKIHAFHCIFAFRWHVKDIITIFQRDTQCSSTDCLLMLRCQLYMFRTVTVHPQELLCRCCMCRLWYVLIRPAGTTLHQHDVSDSAVLTTYHSLHIQHLKRSS